MNQSHVAEFMQKHPQPMTVATCALDVLSEAGEVAKEINIANGWGRDALYIPRENLTKEIGQLLFTVYQLAETVGIDADTALAHVIEDFQERYARQGHTGSSDYIGGGSV